MNWRGLFGFCGALLVMSTACSGSPSAPPAPEAAATIKIMDYSPEQKTFHAAVAAEYNRVHPNITIDWQSIDQASYKQALPLAFQSKQAPDIFWWKSDQDPVQTMAEVMKQGWIKTISPDGAVPQAWVNRWPAGSFQEGVNMKGGKYYGFPFNDTKIWGPGYMYLNNDVFQAAGLDATKPPKTWSELTSACQTIKSKTGKYCMSTPLKGTDFQRTWYALAGSSMTDLFFDYQNGRFALDNPRLLKAFTFIQGLYNAGMVAPGVNDKDFSRKQFAAGQAAIYMDGAWMPSVFAGLNLDTSKYSVAGPPYPDDGPRGALSQRNTENKYWVSSQTKYAKQAWDFLQWMTQPTGFFAQKYIDGSYGTLPFADNSKLASNTAFQAVVKIAMQKSPALRVKYPEPVVACPDVTKSSAMLSADRVHPNWEWQVMVEALVNKKDLSGSARTVVAGRQSAFESALSNEKAQGINVSINCYKFPNWNYDQDYKA